MSAYGKQDVFLKKRKTGGKPRIPLNQRQKKQVKSLISRSIVDKTFGQSFLTTVSANPSFYQLTGINQGVDENARIGDTIHLKRFQFSYSVVCGDEYNQLRLILFRWNQDTQATGIPTYAELMDTATTTDQLVQFYRWQGPKNYTVIYDKVHCLAGDGTLSGTSVLSPWGPSSSFHVKKQLYGKKLGSKIIKLDSGVVTGRNHIYACVLSDSAPASLIHPSISFACLTSYENA